ncbi:hypothetical protein D041_2284A, partial [Vibrio parahaemolyticus EKP-008]
MLKQLRQ